MHKRVQGKGKSMLRAIWMVPSRVESPPGMDGFAAMFAVKSPKAVEWLRREVDVLLPFCAFPAEHWIHLRPTNPIASIFSSVLSSIGFVDVLVGVLVDILVGDRVGVLVGIRV